MRSLPALARLRRLRGVTGLVVLGLLCRALIPVGFMPAAIGAGGPVAVCHGGLAGEFFRRLEAAAVSHSAHGAQYGLDAAQHGHDGAQQGHDSAPAANLAASHDGWDHCPFGAAFGAAALAADFEPALLTLEHALDIVAPAQPAAFRLVSSYRARAPPSATVPS